MTAAALPRAATTRASRIPPNVLGYPTVLLMIWFLMEFCRPTYPLKIPLMISITLLAAWLLDRTKVLTPQVKLLIFFVAVMAISTPFAENYFSAYLVTRVTSIAILCIAIPLGHFVDSMRRFDALLRVWLVSIYYMALFAMTHGGFGPGGARAGLDENYTAMFLSIGIAFSFFLVPATRSPLGKLVLLSLIGFSALGIVVGFSRGGFLGMVAVAGYCWWRSPYKLVALFVAILLGGFVAAVAPAEYWDEVRTITATNEGTADVRLTLWGVATRMYLYNPILGVGPGNFPWNFFEYRTVEEAERYASEIGMNVTHSFYFELIAEMGTAGLIAVGGLVYYNWRDLGRVGKLVRRQRHLISSRRLRVPAAIGARHLADMDRAQAYALGLKAAFLGFFVASAFLSTLYYTTFWILTAVTMSLIRTVGNEVTDFNQRFGSVEAKEPPPSAPTRVSDLATGSPAMPGTAAVSSLLQR